MASTNTDSSGSTLEKCSTLRQYNHDLLRHGRLLVLMLLSLRHPNAFYSWSSRPNLLLTQLNIINISDRILLHSLRHSNYKYCVQPCPKLGLSKIISLLLMASKNLWKRMSQHMSTWGSWFSVTVYHSKCKEYNMTICNTKWQYCHTLWQYNDMAIWQYDNMAMWQYNNMRIWQCVK